ENKTKGEESSGVVEGVELSVVLNVRRLTGFLKQFHWFMKSGHVTKSECASANTNKTTCAEFIVSEASNSLLKSN
ncbi:hypothetical protein DVA76_18290, partial [Acinetobacter baumannii]